MSDNLPQVEAALKAYRASFDMRVAKATMEISLALEGLGKRQIKGQRPVGQKAITGEPPMNRTGNLRRSIRGQTTRIGFAKYSAIVGADMIYARAVEIGNPYNPPSWQNNEHFPYLQPALNQFVQTNLALRILRKHLGVK
jgi:hypothetical protein